MKSQRLNKRIIVYKPVQARDSIGGVSTTMTKVYECWANIKTLDASEVLRYGMLDEVSGVEIYIRWVGSVKIDKTTEIHYKDRVFSVRSIVNENEEDTFFKIMATEKR